MLAYQKAQRSKMLTAYPSKFGGSTHATRAQAVGLARLSQLSQNLDSQLNQSNSQLSDPCPGGGNQRFGDNDIVEDLKIVEAEWERYLAAGTLTQEQLYDFNLTLFWEVW